MGAIQIQTYMESIPKPGAKYEWEYPLDCCGMANTLTAESS
jgi:hypothetical protein